MKEFKNGQMLCVQAHFVLEYHPTPLKFTNTFLSARAALVFKIVLLIKRIHVDFSMIMGKKLN